MSKTPGTWPPLAPDGARISPRRVLSPYLRRPEYVNFIPQCGALVVDGVEDRLYVLGGDGLYAGTATTAQQTAQRDGLRTVPLETGTQRQLASLVADLWRIPTEDRPGRGLIILSDRGLFRRVVYGDSGPPAALALLEALRSLWP